MSERGHAIMRWVDGHFNQQVAFLQELVRIPTDTPPGNNAPHAQAVAGFLEALGWEVERHPVPQAQVRDAGLESITNLIVRRRYGKQGPVVALNAHGDVVPPGEGWMHPPYGAVVENGRLYGRAAAVSKSDFATYVYAVRALEACVAGLNGAVELHFTYDEEVGGLLGPGWLLEQGFTAPDLAICAGFSYNVVTAHNGCLQLAVTVHGKAAHGSMPDTGHDALYAATCILNALYDMAPALKRQRSEIPGINHPTLIVGSIDGGTHTNVVPGKVELTLDRRLIPEEDPDAVECELRRTVENAVSGLPGIQLDIRRLLLARALRPLPGHEQLVAALQQHGHAVFGEDINAGGSPLYTDARLYSEHGVPAVLYGAGPRTLPASNAKQADENVALDDLRGATKVVALALADLLSPA